MCAYLGKLPSNTDGPAQAIAANEEGLHTPAPEMAECKYVKMAQDSLPCDDVTVDCVLLQKAAQACLIMNADNPPDSGHN